MVLLLVGLNVNCGVLKLTGALSQEKKTLLTEISIFFQLGMFGNTPPSRLNFGTHRKWPVSVGRFQRVWAVGG